MGQNMRGMEQVLGNLENQQLISPQQAQKFYNDYKSRNNQSCMNHFQALNPNLKQFLKYYILNKYRVKQVCDKKGKKVKQFKPVSSRKVIQEQLQNFAEKELLYKIVRFFNQTEEYLAETFKMLCGEAVCGRTYIWTTLLVQLIRKSLKIQQFQITKCTGDRTMKYDSTIDYLSFQPQQPPSSSSPALSFTNNESLFTFSWQTTQKSSVVSQILMNANARNQLQKCLIQFINFYDDCQLNSVRSQLQILRLNCLLGFKVVEIGVWARNFGFRKELETIVRGHEIQQYVSIYQFVVRLNQSKLDRTLSEKSLNSLTQPSKKLQNCQKMLKNCQQLLQSSTQFLIFNRYSQLKFAFIDPNLSLSNKIFLCWQQDRLKIIDILSQYEKLLSSLNNISKSQQQTSNVQVKGDVCGLEWLARIEVDDKKIFDGLVVQFKNKIKQRKEIEDSDTVVCRKKDLTSALQQKLVKDLLKQDPELKQSGWLRLFIKQQSPAVKSQHELPNLKISAKWSVIDIQKTDSAEEQKRVQNYKQQNLLNLTQGELKHKILKIMKKNGFYNYLLQTSNNEIQNKLYSFVNQVQYYTTINKNKYHNFHHAVNGKLFLLFTVMHMCSIFCNQTNIKEYLKDEPEGLAVIVSGLCHDLTHTGFTNKYEISIFSERAIIYNDTSPLQNHQSSKTIQLLKTQQTNFLSYLSKQKQQKIKENIIHNILSTDPVCRQEVAQKFQAWTKITVRQEAVRQINALTAMIVHTSDYSGFVKDFSQSKQWSHLLNLQFLNQSELEKKFSVVDKQKQKGAWLSTMLNELQSSILPMFQTLNNYSADNRCIIRFVNNLKNNIAEWEKQNALES